MKPRKKKPPRKGPVQHPRPDDPFFKKPVPVTDLTGDEARYVAIDLLKTAVCFFQGGGQDESAIWRAFRALAYLSKDLNAKEVRTYVTDSIREGREGTLTL